MSAKLKKLAVTLTLTIILLSFTLANVKFVRSNDAGGKIDLFTQKEPYGGKGPNMPSDAFSPQEVVILYALVTYNEIPIQNLLVAFDVKTPSDTSFSLTARTNLSGIATVNFAIQQKCINEDEAFGKWLALANVLIDGKTFQDTLTFKVDWIVKLISVRTIDENLTYRTNFGIEGDVGLEVTLRNIAMVMKSAVIAIVIQDELGVPISYFEIRDFKVQPNEKLVFLYCKLYNPKWAHVGKATVLVSALTARVNESGVAYCPPVSTGFFILPYEPLTITFHDVAIVEVIPSAKSVEVGQPVNITTVIQNEGTAIESVNVSAYYDDVLIETLQVTLAPYSYVTLNFTFDTSIVDPRNYTITVSVPYLINEADLTDNFFVDGVIEIKPKLPTIIHDIAIVNVSISKSSLYIGELLQINVSVINKGTETETFDVGTYYDFSLIETSRVESLAPNAKVTLIFVWNTSLVGEGFYQISASAPLPSDINVSDNTFVDGIVQVKAKPPPPSPTHLLEITSIPISGVNFTINGTPAKTPYSAMHGEGVYTIVFPYEWTDSNTGRRYTLNHWEDGSTNPTRTINLVSDIRLTAHYKEVVEYTLTINTTIGGTTNPSPGSYRYPEGASITVTAIPDAGYEFDHWALDVDIGTENPITIVMDGNHTLTAYFKAVPTHMLSITSDPVLGVEFTIDGVSQATPYSATLEEKSYTIIMPASVTDYTTGKVYDFREWEEGSTNLTRTIFLDRDTNLTAYYKEALKGWFVPDWFYWLLLPLLILIIVLLIIWLYRRKRRKKAREAFYSGWTAWYYYYDLRSKIRKI